MVRYEVEEISPDYSFLEMLDILNETLEEKGDEPVAFDHDCREGICGACSMMVNGQAHGPWTRTTACQLHMRAFKDGDTIRIEPWRARAFPVVKDLMVDRSAFDRIVQAGGYVSVGTGSAPEANLIPIPKDTAELAFDAATCIGCGACVAQCPNRAAQLFTSAKIRPPERPSSGCAGERPARGEHGRADGRGGLRKLLELSRVRSRLPEGHQHRLDCPDEPRLPQGEAEGRQETEVASSRLVQGSARLDARGPGRHAVLT